MSDLRLVHCVDCFNQISSQLLELSNCPVPLMISFEANDLTQSHIHSLHDNYMTVRLRQNVHTRANNIVVKVVVQLRTSQLRHFLDEVDLAKNVGKVMTIFICVGSNKYRLLLSFAVR